MVAISRATRLSFCDVDTTILVPQFFPRDFFLLVSPCNTVTTASAGQPVLLLDAGPARGRRRPAAVLQGLSCRRRQRRHHLSDTEDSSARRRASAASTAERRVAEQEGSSRSIHRTARALRADVQVAAGALPLAHWRRLPELLAGRLADTAGLRPPHQNVASHWQNDGDACD